MIDWRPISEFDPETNPAPALLWVVCPHYDGPLLMQWNDFAQMFIEAPNPAGIHATPDMVKGWCEIERPDSGERTFLLASTQSALDP